MKQTIEQVLLVKYLFERGEDALSEGNDFSTGLAVSLFQDSIELLVWTIAKEVDAKMADKAAFEFVWDSIKTGSKNHESKELPFKARMLDLNKARVGFKHNGNLPAAIDGAKFQVHTEQFLTTSCSMFLKMDFGELSMANLIKDQQIAGHIKAAEKALLDNEHATAVKQAATANALLSRLVDKVIPPLPFDWKDLMPAGGVKDRAKLVEESVTALRAFTVTTAMRLPLAEVIRFKNITPKVILRNGRPVRFFELRKTPITSDEAKFAVRHVTKFALAIELTLSGI